MSITAETRIAEAAAANGWTSTGDWSNVTYSKRGRGQYVNVRFGVRGNVIAVVLADKRGHMNARFIAAPDRAGKVIAELTR